jgi:alpha-1,3-glucosyltransferase
MHGLVLWGVYFMITQRIEWAVVSMVFAVNFKQMALYFGLPFAMMALGMIWNVASQRYRGSRVKQITYLSLRLAGLAVVFLLTMAVVWYPWIRETVNGDPKMGMTSVLTRIFPIRRGLFEDKVASFWCVLNNFIKVHQVFS